MEIAFKDLGIDTVTGLSVKRSIDKKITIDLENKTIIVDGMDYTYTPTGVIISQVPYKYERDNIPEVKEVIAQPAILEVLDASGKVVTEGKPEVIGVVGKPANPRFDIYAASPIGLGIANMIQGTLNGL